MDLVNLPHSSAQDAQKWMKHVVHFGKQSLPWFGVFCLIVSSLSVFALSSVAFEVKGTRVTKAAEDFGIADNRFARIRRI